MLHYFGFTIQLALLRVFNVKMKNLAFDTSKVITNAWFSMKSCCPHRLINIWHSFILLYDHSSLLHTKTIKYTIYSNERIQLFCNTRRLHPLNWNILLFGNSVFTFSESITVVNAVHSFIKNSKHFTSWLFMFVFLFFINIPSMISSLFFSFLFLFSSF